MLFFLCELGNWMKISKFAVGKRTRIDPRPHLLIFTLVYQCVVSSTAATPLIKL